MLLAAAQGGRALVAAGEGGEYRHLQTQCRADKRLPQRLIPSVIGSGGPDGPEPSEGFPMKLAGLGIVSLLQVLHFHTKSGVLDSGFVFLGHV